VVDTFGIRRRQAHTRITDRGSRDTRPDARARCAGIAAHNRHPQFPRRSGGSRRVAIDIAGARVVCFGSRVFRVVFRFCERQVARRAEAMKTPVRSAGASMVCRLLSVQIPHA
jgi:hypothetical protein